MTATRPIFSDFNIMEMDPIQELKGKSIVRNKSRKQPVFSVAEITFIPALFVFADCFLPGCRGHQKYGVVESENIPVVFKYHDRNELPVYVAFKSPISRPIRVPLTDDKLLNGIKWRFNPLSILPTIQCIFDCLLASMKLQSLHTKTFCLECIFRHTNGVGINLEKFLRTVLYHIVSFGRFLDRDLFRPIVKYEKGMNLRFRRIHWEDRNKMFKYCTVVHKRTIKEEVFYGLPGVIDINYAVPPPYGFYLNPDLMFLKNIDLVSFFHAFTTCKCNSGKPYPIKVYLHLIRQHPRSETLSMVPARWENEGPEYSDPLWNWSLIGPEACSKSPYTDNPAVPIAVLCKVCKVMTSLSNFIVPISTWLLMADIPFELRRVPVYYFNSISSFVVNDVIFDLKFIVLYNFETGHFSSMHFFDNQWFYFDDAAGGMMKKCSPDKIKYSNRLNVRSFFFRRNDFNPHACLKSCIF